MSSDFSENSRTGKPHSTTLYDALSTGLAIIQDELKKNGGGRRLKESYLANNVKIEVPSKKIKVAAPAFLYCPDDNIIFVAMKYAVPRLIKELLKVDRL